MVTIKLQMGCLLIMLFIASIYFSARRIKTYAHKLFSISLWISIANLIFDMITVYTVNNLETVEPWLNRACHVLFLGSLIAEVYVCFCYCSTLIYEDPSLTRKKNQLFVIPTLVAYLGLMLLPMDYVEGTEGNYSWGYAVYALFILVFVYIGLTMARLFKHWNELEHKKRMIVVLAYAIQFITLIYQATFSSLISSLGLTLLNLAFFLTVESPDVQLIERLKEEKARADEANAAKSQFLSNMSHEIRTPMNAIVGLTEVLLRKEWAEQETRYLHNIKSSGEALLSLINDLLDFSKVEAGKFVITEEDYSPLELVEELQPIFVNRIGSKNLEMKYEIDPKLPRMLFGDEMRIRQIILNLVNNAIKFTESGHVKLSLQVQEMTGSDVELLISVQDTGIGIRQEDLEKLFDAFTQVDLKKNKSQEGTGLGLAICKQLVELMGGKLGVKSEYGRGSCFYFTLRQKAISKESVGEYKVGSGSDRYRTESSFGFTLPEAKVLLVDDNIINQEVAKALLEPLKMQIEVAENGLEALHKVQQKEYDLIFMDHYMPVMDGVEATVKIRELEGAYYKNVPIIALTADAIAGDREKFLAAGMNDMVAKPIQIKEICGKIQLYLVKRES